MPKSVLVIDAIATHRIRFAALLESAHYAVTSAPTAGDVAGGFQNHDLIVLGLPDDQPARVLSALSAALGRPSVPILCLDAKRSSLRRLLALRSGVRDVLPSKSPDDLLLARVRGLIREHEAERECERRRLTAVSFGFSEPRARFAAPAFIVCLGELGELPEQIAALLPHRVVALSESELANVDMTPTLPDAFILGMCEDASLAERVLPELRDRMHLRPAPILVRYPADRPDIASRALALGASEVVENSVGIEEMEMRIKGTLARKHLRDALRKSDEQSYRLAATDALTGLYNRRYAETYIGDLSDRVGEDASEICLVLLDLDHFKAVNDVHGHVAGDCVLREVGHRIQTNLRACDLVARYGGEEFLVVLPDTSSDEALVLAERLRASIAARPVRVAETCDIPVTASIGVASGLLQPALQEQRTGTFDAPASDGFGSLLPVFEAADAALYRAKAAGRNRVEFSGALDP